jgi:peroxiredoxin
MQVLSDMLPKSEQFVARRLCPFNLVSDMQAAIAAFRAWQAKKKAMLAMKAMKTMKAMKKPKKKATPIMQKPATKKKNTATTDKPTAHELTFVIS